jgi:hypothetical protein
MENKFSKSSRKATLVKNLENSPDSKDESLLNEKNSNLNKKIEIYKEITNFKEIISNSVLNEILQLQYFSNLDQQSKIKFKTNLDFIVSNHLDNLISRIQKKF